MGESVDEIASDHSLTLADVHAALAYYFDHRFKIDKAVANGQAFASPCATPRPQRSSTS